MKTRSVPYLFIRERVLLSWRDALWGYEHQFIGWTDIIDIATDRLLLGSSDPLEVELSCLGKSETPRIGELLRVLAYNEPDNHLNKPEKKWLFLVLAWLFENRAVIPDPFVEIEYIYAEFDYPPEIEGFVSYMPASDGYDPSQHSTEENRERLITNWGNYLSKTSHELGE
ncbi:hypothetical protein D9M68_271760 [compost metagenome]